MKNVFTLLFLLAMLAGKGQTFEGSIHWSVSMEITDPAMKKKMEQAQQQLNNPETQAQLKEMQEKMNDPEMKKMMEANPQMKAAMENAMKSAAGGGAPGGTATMMPRGLMMKIKGGNMVSVMEGGMADGMEVLHVKDQPATRINRVEKTYSKMPEGQAAPPNQAKVIATGEKMTLLGYACEKYIVEIEDQGKTVTQVFWTTKEIKDMDMKAMSGQRMGQGGQSMYYDQMEGVPLKMELSSPQGKMIMETTEIKRLKLKDSEFVIPSGFKEVKMPGGY